MDLRLAGRLTETPDLAHRLRRLSFFDAHFRRSVAALAARRNLEVRVDTVRLTRAFLAWGEDFTRQRAAAAVDRRDYTVFAAGMLLARLLEAAPLSVARQAAAPDSADDIAAVWPEGVLYAEYCLNALQAVLHQRGEAALHLAAAADDPRVWWSLRENVGEDAASAIGFFDLFVGAVPNWRFPWLAADRPAMGRPIMEPGMATAP